MNNLQDKLILITGSTDGIGKATAIELAKLNAGVIVHGRSQKKAKVVMEEIKLKTGNPQIYMAYADLCSFEDIKAMSHQLHGAFNALDILINNAGVIRSERRVTSEGLEETFAVNYVAPFMLTNLLIDLLKKSTPSRIINVASQVHANHLDFDNLQHERGYSAVKAYALSKTCIIMFTYLLAEELKNSNNTVNTLHPGVINTKLLKAGWGPEGDSVNVGAAHLIYIATAPELEKITGKYFKNDEPSPSKDITYSRDLQNKLWQKTEELIGIKFTYN